jgi:hypothetical protein
LIDWTVQQISIQDSLSSSISEFRELATGDRLDAHAIGTIEALATTGLALLFGEEISRFTGQTSSFILCVAIGDVGLDFYQVISDANPAFWVVTVEGGTTTEMQAILSAH